MTLLETYKRNIGKIREEHEKKGKKEPLFIDVSKPSNSEFAPSLKLADALRNEEITWNVFVTRFKAEMSIPSIHEKLLNIAKQASPDDIDVYLVCYEAKAQLCHRTVLLDMIEEIAAENDIPLKVVKPTIPKKR